MSKHISIAAMLLMSVVLGATVFREPIAWAAQAVTATIVGPLDASGHVAVHEQGTANVNVTNEALPVAAQPASTSFTLSLAAFPNTANEVAFLEGPIDASLITFTGLEGDGYAQVYTGSQVVLSYNTSNRTVVLPLPQALTIEGIRLYCSGSSPTPCFGEFNVVGK